MRFQFTTFLLLTVTSVCFSQITLTSTDMPVPLTVLTNGVDTLPSGITPGPAGANQVWDFSGVTQHITETSTHETVAASGYAGDFPTATNAVTPNGASYGFFRNTTNAFVGLGLAGDLIGSGTIFVVDFVPTFDLYQFPTQYGNDFNGSYGFQTSTSGASVGQPVDEVRITFTSTYFDTIDGYGITKTPVGSYRSLRQKRVEQTRTLIEIKLFPISPWTSVADIIDTSTNYSYLALESQGPVVALGFDSLDNVNRVTYSLAAPKPIADFTDVNPYGGTGQFTDQSLNTVNSYSWDFGDGNSSTQQSPTHNYASNGVYTVCLTVTNAVGSDTYCDTILVDGIFTTSISGSSNLCSDAATGISYSTTNTAGHNYFWTVNGGTIASGAGTSGITVDWTGNAPYSVQLIECDGTNNFCDTASLAITIQNAPQTLLNETICQGENFEGYTTSGTFTDQFTAANGCDSTRILNLTVLPTYSITIDSTVCFGESVFGYTATGTYRDTLTAANTCDSIRILNLTIRTENRTVIDTAICVGETFEGYDSTDTYIETYTDQHGCDSIRVINLTVRPVNATTLNVSICPGSVYEGYSTTGTYTDMFTDQYGCDSTRTLNLNVQANVRDTVDMILCYRQTFFGYDTTGTYSDTFSFAGCDSIRLLNLTVLPENLDTVHQSICQGESHAGYFTTGTYVDVFTGQYGCDSTRTLFLTVLSNTGIVIDTTICYGTTFFGYDTTGTYYDTFPAFNTCDSIRTINLTVKPQNLINISRTICDGETYEGYGNSGSFTDVFTGGDGCDSTRVLDLTVLPNSTSTIAATICYDESFAGYNMTGTYQDTFTAASTCDSIRTINLTVLPLAVTQVSDTICQGDSLYGYSSNGTYTDTLTGVNGCDSVRVLQLVVTSVLINTTSQTICVGDSVFAAGEWQTKSGTYSDTTSSANCLEIDVLELTVITPPTPIITETGGVLSVLDVYDSYEWYLDGALVGGATTNELTPGAAGEYVLIATDSNGCGISSFAYDFVVGLGAQNALSGIRFYPNPTTGLLIIETGSIEELDVQVVNGLGQVLFEVNGFRSGRNVDLSHLANGVYFIRVSNTTATRVEKLLLVD